MHLRLFEREWITNLPDSATSQRTTKGLCLYEKTKKKQNDSPLAVGTHLDN